MLFSALSFSSEKSEQDLTYAKRHQWEVAMKQAQQKFYHDQHASTRELIIGGQ